MHLFYSYIFRRLISHNNYRISNWPPFNGIEYILSFVFMPRNGRSLSICIIMFVRPLHLILLISVTRCKALLDAKQHSRIISYMTQAKNKPGVIILLSTRCKRVLCIKNFSKVLHNHWLCPLSEKVVNDVRQNSIPLQLNGIQLDWLAYNLVGNW